MTLGKCKNYHYMLIEFEFLIEDAWMIDSGFESNVLGIIFN